MAPVPKEATAHHGYPDYLLSLPLPLLPFLRSTFHSDKRAPYPTLTLVSLSSLPLLERRDLHGQRGSKGGGKCTLAGGPTRETQLISRYLISRMSEAGKKVGQQIVSPPARGKVRSTASPLCNPVLRGDPIWLS